ncbi:scarecrow-like protein 34 [Panicum hallii]|uniref:scarecrow-like protein 34 n=1 Tax=Panicum hallii TaxID=206008 RepID=UPI000DF4ECAF|nr:scarecrow-like protein 34 [Panicum hallii]
MATTPEEFFAEGLMDPSPPSPVVFLDFLLIPEGCQGPFSPDDTVLSYVSDMLMEEDSGDKLLYQYSDHSALVQVQQPFAQILSPPSSRVDHDNRNRGDMDEIKDLFQNNNGHQSTLDPAFSRGVDAVGAFLRGMEEAKMFLPNDNGFRRDELVNCMSRESSSHCGVKKRHNRDKHQDEVSRASKAVKMMEQEEIGAHKMFNEMMFRGYEICITSMENLLISMAMESEKNNRKSTSNKTRDVVNLRTLLVLCAQAVAANNHMSARELLKQIKKHASASGDATQRLAQCFAKGLEARLVGTGLLRLLASREGGPPEVKVTAIGCPNLRSCPTERTEDTGMWLSKCAREFGLPFKFHAIMMKSDKVCIEDLKTDDDEVLVVNDLFNFSTLMDESVFFDHPSPRDIVLNNIRNMRPNVFIQSIVNYSCGSSFLSWIRGALFYYTSLFDMLDATIPRENQLRVLLEQGLLGHAALNAIACEGVDLMDRPEKYKQWQVRNQRAGLRQLPLKPHIVKELKEKVKQNHHNEFLISEDGQWLLQGWTGHTLFAHSTWVAEDAPSK